jgi:hypothetical protein
MVRGVTKCVYVCAVYAHGLCLFSMDCGISAVGPDGATVEQAPSHRKVSMEACAAQPIFIYRYVDQSLYCSHHSSGISL